MVPNGWEIKSLDKIATITSGGTPSRNIPEYWKPAVIPWIRTTEVQNCYLYPHDVKEYISVDGQQNSSAKFVPENSILMAMIGQGKTRGQVALTKFETTINQNCAAIILKENNTPEFYYQYFLSQYEIIRRSSNSAGQSNLSAGLIKKFKVPVPPFKEQTKIVKVLSTWDKAIEATKKLINNSQAQKRALMQQLLTGKKRLSDENGERFSGKWEKGNLKTIARVAKGKALSSKNLLPGIFPVIAGGKSSPYQHAEYTHENIITVSASGAFAGYVAYHNYKIWASDCSTVMGKNKNNTLFIYYLLCLLQNKIYSLQSGGAQPHIYPKDLDSLTISFPINELEQIAIATVLSKADREIELLENKLEYLKQEKKALMQQLLTGKRRVTIN